MAFETLAPSAALWRPKGLRYLLAPPALREAAEEIKRPARPAFAKNPAPKEMPVQARQQPETPLPAPQEWPEAWQQLLARTRKGLIAWTYPELGEDLAGKGAPGSEGREARKGFLKRILSDLRHPAGTHTFWPAGLSEGAGPDPAIFWAGVKALGCRGALIMDPALAALLTGHTGVRAYRMVKCRGQFVWVLPALTDFQEKDYQRLLKSLVGALKDFVGSR